ncbi:hypothetical protein JCM6882_007330 [Rhodosporidiobolus microsporus]
MRPRLPRLPRLPVAVPPPHATTSTAPSTASDTTSRAARAYSVGAAAAPTVLRTPSAASAAASAAASSTANFPRETGATRFNTSRRQGVAQKATSSGVDGSRAPRARAPAAAAGPSLFEDYPSEGGRGEQVRDEPRAGPSRRTVERSTSSTTRPRPPPSLSGLPRSLLFPSADVLFEDSFPYTEPELYSYLHTVKATQPSFRPEDLASFHAKLRFVRLVSTRTYRFLLHYAFEASNLRLVQSLLAEMADREIRRDEYTLRVLLRGYLRHGKDAAAEEVARAMQQRGVVLVSTKPRVTTQQGKGKEKEREDFDALWKAFEVRGRETRLREEAAQRVRDRESPRASLGVHTKKGRRRVVSFGRSSFLAPSSAVSPPRTVDVPPDPASLSGSDISTVVSCLAEEGRGATAFRVAEMWLQANRPSYDPASSHLPSPPASKTFFSSFRPDPNHDPSGLQIFGERAALYQSTALVLLDILLRTLFSERATATSVRTYLRAFLARHSAPPPARPLTPNAATLRTLVSGLKGVPNAWQDGVDMVDWFGYLWGIPVAGKPHSDRIFFQASRRDKLWLRDHFGLKEDDLATGPAVPDSAPPSPPPPRLERRRPHTVVPADVALLLLNHATDSFRSRAIVGRARVAEVRDWWTKELDRDPKKNELWASFKSKKAWRKAAASGLMVAKKQWWRKKEREVVNPVVTPSEARGRGRTRDPKAKAKKAPH